MIQINFKYTLIVILGGLLIISSSNSYSQEKQKKLEFGAYNTDEFSVRYKFGNENRLFRISLLSLGLSSSKVSNEEDTNTNVNAGIGFGIEFPKQLNEKMTVYYGTELQGQINIKEKKVNQSYQFALNGILGFTYSFNEVIGLGAEITPGISYNYFNQNDVTSNILKFGFTNQGAALVLSFSF